MCCCIGVRTALKCVQTRTHQAYTVLISNLLTYLTPFFSFSQATTSSAVTAPLTLYENLPLIPESYVKNLYSKAKLLSAPKQLVTRGTITLQLDDNDHILEITTDFVQVNN